MKRKPINNVISKRVLQFKIKHLNEALEKRKKVNVLREGIRKYLFEAELEGDKKPYEFTGINVLRDLLKRIIPTLESDYKQLTTNVEQRQAFRKHILLGLQNTIQEYDIYTQKGLSEAVEDDEVPDMDPDRDGEIDVAVEDDVATEPELDDVQKFIDIHSKSKESQTPDDEEQEKDIYADEAPDERTGRMFANDTIDKIDSQISKAYEKLSNKQDREVFMEFLLSNVRLYFEKFEDEMFVDNDLGNDALDNIVDDGDSTNNSEDVNQDNIFGEQ